MGDGSGTAETAAARGGFVAPITGLLALVFALMAGISIFPAVTGSPGDLAIPIIFGIASILSVRLRQRYLAADD